MAEHDKPMGSVELAEKAGVSDAYIRRLCIDGRLPGAYKIGKTWLIPADVGNQWLAERRAKWEKFNN
jgi:excisionase family DNA binding protein